MESRLDAIGLQPFTEEELRGLSLRLSRSISIGLARTGAPTTTDGGALAAPTGMQPITLEQVQQVPDGVRGITAACGGTNWVFAETRKEPSGQVTMGRSATRKFLENERQYTYDSFTEIIAEGIAGLAKECGLMNESTLPVSISLGFPQINTDTAEGDVDALLPRRKLPKFWVITDYDESVPALKQPSLAQLIKVKFTAKGISGVDQIVILNDTVAVALDVQHGGKDGADAPVGFVFGTGTNAALFAGQKKGLVNLEIGHTEVMEQDKVLEVMQRHGWVPENRSYMEYWMGGAFLSARVMAAVELVGELVSDAAAINQQIAGSDNQSLVSELAQGGSAGLSLADHDLKILQACSQRVLHQAAQLIGVHLVTVCQAAKAVTGAVSIPYEGSVLGKGFEVRQQALEVVKLLLPKMELKPYEASGMVGVAKLAMVRLFR